MPTSTTSESPPQARTLHRILRIVLGLILTATVLALLALATARGALARAEQKAVAEGSTLDTNKLHPETDAPADNAHSYIQAASRLLIALDDSAPEVHLGEESETLRLALAQRLRRELRHSGETPTPDDLELFRRTVEHYGLVLDTLDAARAIESSHYDYDRGNLIEEAHVPEILRRLPMSDFLAARIRLAAAEGNAEKAWHDIHAMLRLATWTSQEMPTLVQQLIATAILRFAAEEASFLLRTSVPGPDQMERILAEARSWDPQAAYDLALESDRATIVTALLEGQPLGSAYENSILSSIYLQPIVRPWLYWNLVAYSDAMAQLSADCRLPGHRRERVVGVEDRMKELYPVPFWATAARIYISSNVFDACDKRDMTLARTDLMEIAFRLEQYRKENGIYPASLDALSGIPSEDPFSGGPYVYRPEATGALLYSLGPNIEDDGGTSPPAKYAGADHWYIGDLVWRLGG